MPDLHSLLILGGIALVAGFIDTLAGGGGLLTLPALLLSPLPPIQALATNKLQGSFGTLTASLTLLSKGHIGLPEVWRPFLLSMLGGALGAVTVQLIDSSALTVVVPFILLGIAGYFLLSPKAGEVESHPRMGDKSYHRLVVPLIGFYDGFLGPGTGSFFSLAGVVLRGQSLQRATIHAKLLNCATNLASLSLFIAGGKVVWLTGGVMALGQMAGAYAGSHAIIRGGSKLIRPLIVLMCLAMTGRYLYAHLG